MISLWRGHHTPDLRTLVERAWIKEELLILGSPLLHEFDFVRFLPDDELQLIGEWDAEAPARLARVARAPATYPAKPVLGVFTTGSVSGQPRLILYSKANIQASLDGVRSFFDTSRIGEIFCYPQPFHTFGLNLGYVHAIEHDLKLWAPPGRYSRDAHGLRLDTRIDHARLLTLGTAAHFHDLAQFTRHEGRVPKATYASIAGGVKVSVGLWRTMRDELLIEAPSIGYGASEASPGITHLPAGQMPLEDGEIGVPLPGVEVTLRPGAGLEFVGANVCLAMIQGAERIEFPSRVLIRDDIQLRERDGVMLYRARHELTLNRGGFKFSLEAVEEALVQRFKLDVVCVAVPDARLSEELGLVVKRPLAIERLEIWAFLKSHFGHAFNPAHFAEVDALPMNASSKLDRKACARLLEDQAFQSWMEHGGELPGSLAVSKLESWLPHRAPAVWVDRVNWVSDEGGECLVKARLDANYISERNGRREIRDSSLLEWIAQGYGFVRSCQVLSKNVQGEKAPAKAYLVALRNVEFFDRTPLQAVSEGQVFRITVKRTHQIGPIALVDGTVSTGDEKLIAKAQLRLYAE